MGAFGYITEFQEIFKREVTTMAEFWRQKEAEALALAKYYERVPEDKQKAAGARQARADAAFYRKLAEEEEAQ